MCGRFTLFTDAETLRQEFRIDTLAAELRPRYNIAPGQDVAVVVQRSGERRLEMFRWGLIPSWAKDPSIGQRMINARAETLAERPAFKQAFRRRRCLVPADGFYEWQKGGRRKTPFYFRLKSGRPFALAGLWEEWLSPEGQTIRSCTIITTAPNELLAPIHERMPAILLPEAIEVWLDPSATDPALLHPWLKPYPADRMTGHPVPPIVNSPTYDSESLLPFLLHGEKG